MEFKIVNTALVRVYRSVNKSWNYGQDNPVTDDQVMSELKVPNLSMLLVRARLLHLPRLLKSAPNILLADVQDSWPDMIIKDLSWQHSVESKLAELPMPREGLQKWLSFLPEHPREWNKFVVLATTCNSASRGGPYKDVASPGQYKAIQIDVNCDKCNQSFSSMPAYRPQCYRKHQEYNLARKYANGSRCSICGMEHQTRPRFIHHLRVPKRCLAHTLASHLLPLSMETQQEMDRADRVGINAAKRQGRNPSVMPAWKPPI